MSVRWWNTKPQTLLPPPTETLTQKNTQSSFLCEKSWEQLRVLHPSAQPTALTPHSSSHWLSAAQSGEDSQALGSPWGGKDKTGPYFQHLDFFGSCLRDCFLSCLNQRADREEKMSGWEPLKIKKMVWSTSYTHSPQLSTEWVGKKHPTPGFSLGRERVGTFVQWLFGGAVWGTGFCLFWLSVDEISHPLEVWAAENKRELGDWWQLQKLAVLQSYQREQEMTS